MGTGMSDRTVVSNNLGAMYGTLVFFESSLNGLLSSDDQERLAKDIFPDETVTLADAHFGLSVATRSFEKFVGQLSGVDKAAFVAGVASAAKAVGISSFEQRVYSNE